MPAIGFRDQHRLAGNGHGIALDAPDGARCEDMRAVPEGTRPDAQGVNGVGFQFVVKICHRAGAPPLAGNNHRQTSQLRPVSYSHSDTTPKNIWLAFWSSPVPRLSFFAPRRMTGGVPVMTRIYLPRTRQLLFWRDMHRAALHSEHGFAQALAQGRVRVNGLDDFIGG